MSREIRRVPMDWRHPVEPDPYWVEQKARALARFAYRKPTLHAEDERFVGLFDDYAYSLQEWQREGERIQNRTGHPWEFFVEYHLTGFRGYEDMEPVVHPFYVDKATAVEVRDEDHLHTLAMTKHASERPNPVRYMPVFHQPEETLGWCLYETVSEGTPITPIFATSEELIEHLATVGTEWSGPMRRASAEAIVETGGTLGSVLVVNGQVLNSTEDADKIQELVKEGKS